MNDSRSGTIGHFATPDELVFTFRQGEEEEISTAAQLGTDGIKFTHHQRKIPFLVGLQSARERTDRADAIRLGSLRKRKQGDVVLEALRVIEPRLRSIEENSASGFPMIWGDIGLSELVPLAVMGEGITRFASIVLTMVEVPGGVMLIDEVENGIHHSVLTDVWRMIDDASRRFGVQVFATTHSFECVHAADQAIQTDDLALHRLEIEDDRCRCVTYERSEKARTCAYLATTRHPHVSVGVAAKKGVWDFEHDAFSNVREFLSRLGAP